MEPVDGAIALSPWTPGALSLVVYAGLITGVLAALLFLTGWLGEKSPNPEKSRPYECGIVPTGPGRFRYPVPFHLVAVFFLIFDVETAFIFAWASASRRLGVAGWLQISFFILVLLLSLFYVWGRGGLEWGRSRPRAPR